MKIALQFAMPVEFRALPGTEGLEPFETVSGVPFYDLGEGLTACVGGVSKVNAAMAAEILCLKYGVDMILNAGIAGCATSLPTGTLVVAREFLQHDVDTSGAGDPVGMVSTVNRTEFPTWAPERCTALLRTMGCEAVLGRVATGDWFAVKGGSLRLDSGHLPPGPGGDGGLCHRPGVPAERCPVRVFEIRVRPSVLRQPDGGVF